MVVPLFIRSFFNTYWRICFEGLDDNEDLTSESLRQVVIKGECWNYELILVLYVIIFVFVVIIGYDWIDFVSK
jgi:hypothetical protein